MKEDPEETRIPCPTCGADLIEIASHDGGKKYICKGVETHRWTPETLPHEWAPPLVSVICPTKDRPQFMAQLLKGFLTQDYAGPAQLIVIYDGDNSGNVLSAYPDGPIPVESRDVYFHRAEGIAPTIGSMLNQAIGLAGGEYIFRFDDDDWQAPDRISRQMQLFEMTGKAVTACSSGLYWTEGDPVAYEYTGEPWASPGSSHAFRRDYGLAHPHPEISRSEDAAFIQGAYEEGDLATISGAPWLVARNHPGNTCPRGVDNPLKREMLLASDNWRQRPVERVKAIIGGTRC